MTVGDDFDDFVRTRGDDLRRLAYLLTNNRDDAEDLVQSTLVRTLPKWSRIVAADEPYAYVRAVLINTRRGWWRKERGRTVPHADVPDRPLARDEIGGVVVRDEVRTALRALPAGQQRVLVLRYFEDLSEAETAHILKCSIGTVKSQNARALARLRGVMSATRADYTTDGSARS